MAQRITTTETDDREVDARREPARDPAKRFEDVIWFILAVIAAIIVVRFVLLLFGAREGVPFVDFWYGLSAPFIAPFAGMFGNGAYNTYNGSRLEVEALVALLIYSLTAYLLVLGIRLLTPNSDERKTS